MKFYVTTPIYYVNDVPHVGHTYTTVAADVLARWHKLTGDTVFFLTGSDEHGAKICEAANKKNLEPQKYCDEIVEEFKNTWKLMNISYNSFIRTTDAAHVATVEKFLSELHKRGDVYLASYEGDYCIQCEKFLTETELVDGCCPDHKTKPSKHSEKNYFFKLSKYKEQLLEIILDKNHPQHFEILPEERRNEITGKLKVSLEDISISRASLPWAIPLPFDKAQTTYVWIDALINYISACGYGNPEFNIGGFHFDKVWPADLHLMAKDILWFHSVIWPAMLLSVGLPLPKKVYAHGFFTVKGQKMSKTIGNVLKPQELVDRFGVDASRFLVLNAFPFGSDGDMNVDDFVEKYNAYLANNIGNLVSRVTNMVDKYFGGEVKNPGKPDDARLAELKESIKQVNNCLEKVEIDKAISVIINLATSCNQYIDSEAPWKLAKTDPDRLAVVLYNSLLMIKYISILISSFMPDTAKKIWEAIDEKGSLSEYKLSFEEIEPLSGNKIKKAAILFPKMEK